ncbi:OLC1v1028948C1 [Oldenlandia corymbosa var. corymbosa]|uniref:OLC1v1028948C1 n=1 Tax=Oldenlandia corymbosa var. corymbosa TaxID=529605 RepID=A0AAV1CCW8_OLDCO|nr:OLC1v1028948C1 [Oldenlandia corymbosa var. corymbosa]
MDVFVCTADPFKEPPLSVVNTALSVLAYDYPPEKLSVYVSDDGGSELTLFAFMEAAKFGRFWLPFCKEYNIMDRCPDAYFKSNYSANSDTQFIKEMYENMKEKIENVVEKGNVTDEDLSSEEELEAFSKWKRGIFTPQQHPSVIQVLLESDKDKDTAGNPMPNLIYVSREKSKASPHNFKAGALNTLIRVSAVMTNAPIILTLDCDMFSNDPKTAERVICFMMDPPDQSKLGYIQFPQMYHGLNKADIYAVEFKQPFQINAMGMDGFRGPNHVGTGCFFNRRVFFGGPSSFVQPEMPELRPDYTPKKNLIKSPSIVNLAHQVSGCNYENQSNWGLKIGFKYGTLVEDFYSGYRLQCEGWHSMFYHPKRPAFLGDVPITLIDVITQHKRWFVGFLDVAFSKYSPLTFGVRSMGFLQSSIYVHYSLWAIWSIPIVAYAFIPQLALLNNISIFPKASDGWFLLYSFLFLGAYGQQCIEFIQGHSTTQRWWSDQRFWLIKGLTSYPFAAIEFVTKLIGIDASKGFNVTSKVVDDEQGKMYDQGIFEFGVASPMFVPLSMAAILNLVSFLYGFLMMINLDGFFVQMFIAGFGVMNSLPVLEAMVFRSDKGRMPTKITIISACLVFVLYGLSFCLH